MNNIDVLQAMLENDKPKERLESMGEGLEEITAADEKLAASALDDNFDMKDFFRTLPRKTRRKLLKEDKFANRFKKLPLNSKK